MSASTRSDDPMNITLRRAGKFSFSTFRSALSFGSFKNFSLFLLRRSISKENKSHPAMRSAGCDTAFSHWHTFTMLAPSGMRYLTQPSPLPSPIGAGLGVRLSANKASRCAVLYECALMVLMSTFPAGIAARAARFSTIDNSESLSIKVVSQNDSL